MTDEPDDFKLRPGDGDIESGFVLSREDADLAKLLSQLGDTDFAQILFLITPSARDEVRAAIGTMQAVHSFRGELS